MASHNNRDPQRSMRPRAFSTVPSFPSCHFNLDGTPRLIQPLPQSFSRPWQPTMVEAPSSGSGSGYSQAHSTPQVPGPQPIPTGRFITSPTSLLQEVNRDPLFVFNWLKNMAEERTILRNQNKELFESNIELMRWADSNSRDCLEILTDYKSCLDNFNKLCGLKDQKLSLVFAMMDRLGHTQELESMGYHGLDNIHDQIHPVPILARPRTPDGGSPGLVGPFPLNMNLSVAQLHSWRQKYPMNWSPTKYDTYEQSIPEEDSSWGEGSVLKTESKSSDDGSNDTKLDPNANEFVPTTASTASDASLTPTPTMRTLGGNSIMFAESPTPHPYTGSSRIPSSSSSLPETQIGQPHIPAYPPGTYKAFVFQPYGTPLENLYPTMTAADITFNDAITALPPRFFNICPFSLSSDSVNCPLGMACKLQVLCQKYIDPEGPGVCQKRDCVMVHELRSCEREVKGEQCLFSRIDYGDGGGKKGNRNGNGGGGSKGTNRRGGREGSARTVAGNISEEWGGGKGSLVERARKHSKCRAHKSTVDAAEWDARVTVAWLKEPHINGRY